MIKVGIIGDLQDEDQIYQILHNNKNVEQLGLYSPDRDFNSEKFKIYHNPIELLELSDAIMVYSQQVSFEYIQLMIRKSIHIYFKRLPQLKASELSDLCKLQKEAGNIIHLYNPLLTDSLKIKTKILSGAKIVNLQLALNYLPGNIASQLMCVLTYLYKIENSTIKDSNVLALKGDDSQATIHIHLLYSNGSAHNILLSDQSIKSKAQFFQANQLLRINFEKTGKKQEVISSPEDIAFQNFTGAISGNKNDCVSLEDFNDIQKSYLDIREKLNYIGI